MADELKVLGVCGSLRKASFSMAALRACKELAPAGLSISIANIGDLPMYNQDVFDAGIPQPAKRFYDEVAAADGVLIATPEYNFSLPPLLKNAIDWVSKMPNQPFDNKPVRRLLGVAGPARRRARSVRRAQDPRSSSGASCCRGRKSSSARAQTKFDTDGKLTDEATKKFLTDLLAGFKTLDRADARGKPK